jgi:hypothetical protein
MSDQRSRGGLRWWQTLLLAVGGVLALFGLLVALLIASLVGAFESLLGGDDPPRPEDARVVAARERASGPLAADAERVTTVVGPALGPGAVTLGGGEVRPYCTQGQHNWKIDDDFDLICDLEHVQLVAVQDKGSFRADMAALDAALVADGWSPYSQFGMGRVLEHYWDPYGTTEPPEPGTRPSMPNYPDGYSMDDLPDARYTKDVGGETRTLVVGWAERGSYSSLVTGYGVEAYLRDATGKTTTPADLVAAVPADGYAVVVTVAVEYFHE